MKEIFQRYQAEVNAAEVERRTLMDQEWLVAPVVLVKEMILNGGFAPYEELQQSAPGWDGRPVTLYHPESDDGGWQMANTPEVLASATLGRVFNVEPDDEIRGLRGQLWTHIGAVQAIGGDAEEAAEQIESEDDVLEVSTGYWMTPVQEDGVFNGERYEQIQTNIMPDHLAALPNQTGKCSVEDGCGAPVANLMASGESAVANRVAAINCDGCDGDCGGAANVAALAETLGSDADLDRASTAVILRSLTENKPMKDKLRYLAENTDFTAEELAEMEDATVERFHESIHAANTAAEEAQNGAGDAPDDDPTNDGDGDTSPAVQAVLEQLNSLNETVESVQERLDEQENAERDHLISTIEANSDEWDRETLENIENTEVLEKLAADTAPAASAPMNGVNYARPGGAGTTSENEEPDMPIRTTLNVGQGGDE